MNGEMAATFNSDPQEQLLSEVDNGAGGHTGIIVKQRRIHGICWKKPSSDRFGDEYGNLQFAFV